MATTPTSPAPAPAGAPPSAPKKDNTFDDLSAGAAWLLLYTHQSQILSTARRVWNTTWAWVDDFQFERNHRWTVWVRWASLIWMGLLALLLFGNVPESQWTTSLLTRFAFCEGVLLVVALATIGIRSATTQDLRTFRDAAEAAEAEHEAADKAYANDPTPANDALRLRALGLARTRRQECDRFLAHVGPSNRPALLLGFIAWAAIVRLGFALASAAMHLHMTEGVRQSRLEAMLFSSSSIYFVVGVFPIVLSMYLVSILGSAVVKAEKGAHMARQGVQGVLTPGGVTGDTIDAKERAEDKAEGHEPGRMSTEVAIYRYWQSCVSVLIASFGQLLLIWQWTNASVSIRSAKYSFVVTCIELLIYWGLKDPTLRRKKEPRWVSVIALASLIPVTHFLIMGGYAEMQDGELVYGPASAWLHHGPIAWARSATETVADSRGYLDHLWESLKASLYVIDFSGGQVIRTLIVGLILIGSSTWLVVWLAKKTAPDKDATSPFLKSGRNFALAVLAIMTVAPACVVTAKQLAPSNRSAPLTPERQEIVQELDRYGRASDRSTALTVRDGANRLEADNARRVHNPGLDHICQLNSLGYTRCTGECFAHHHWLLPPGQTISDMQSQGRCYTQ